MGKVALRLRIQRSSPASQVAEAPSPEEAGGDPGRPDPVVRARSPVTVLRILLLLLGVSSVVVVVLLLAAYRFGRAATEVDDLPEGVVTSGTSDQILAGAGFDYTQSSGEDDIFRIRAETSQQDRDGTSYLTKVLLDIFHEDGQTYTVRSDRARVNESSWDTYLEGNVVLSGWEALELEARALELRQGGQLLSSTGAVEFRYPPDYIGRASSLQVDRRNDTITLSGGVHLHTIPGAERPMRLDCERLIYQSSGGLIRAVGEARLENGAQTIEGHYLTIFLAEDGETVQSVRARWNVVGRSRIENELGEVTDLEYRGQFVDVQPHPKVPGAQRIKLDGEGETVTLSMTDASGLRRELTGLYLIGETRGGRPFQVEGVGAPLVLSEGLEVGITHPLRQACAERLTAGFLADGSLARVQLEHQVELHDPDLSLFGGGSAAMNLEDGMFRIQGDSVRFFSPQAEVEAPQFTYARRTGLVRAYQGVHATLAQNATRALASTPLGQGRGPVQVDADEAYWTLSPPTFFFEGQVRAWRGDNLLMADQLRGEEQSQELTASGNVRTLWTPLQRSTGGTDGSASTSAIEVSASHLSYIRETGRLIYHDLVELRQDRRRIRCQELTVELDATSHAERMICEQEVELMDPDNGQRVKGDRAVYELARREVEVFGKEVLLFDAQNNRMSGSYLLYDMETGTFKLKSQRPDSVRLYELGAAAR